MVHACLERARGGREGGGGREGEGGGGGEGRESAQLTLLLWLLPASKVGRDELFQRVICLDGGFTDKAEGGLTAFTNHTIDTLDRENRGGRGIHVPNAQLCTTVHSAYIHQVLDCD